MENITLKELIRSVITSEISRKQKTGIAPYIALRTDVMRTLIREAEAEIESMVKDGEILKGDTLNDTFYESIEKNPKK